MTFNAEKIIEDNRNELKGILETFFASVPKERREFLVSQRLREFDLAMVSQGGPIPFVRECQEIKERGKINHVAI